MTNKDAVFEAAIFTIVVLMVGVLWFNFYVTPREEFLNSVMDCMDEIQDSSQEGYTSCAERVREARM